jgi:hypothetical protein
MKIKDAVMFTLLSDLLSEIERLEGQVTKHKLDKEMIKGIL